jgi:hypothetical protein
VPWDDVYIIWCYLNIANMNFNEFVEEEEGDELLIFVSRTFLNLH